MLKFSASDKSRNISVGLMVAGGILLVLNIILGEKVNLSLPFVFIFLGMAVYLLTFALSRKWHWTFGLFIPGSMLISLGFIFFIFVITSDWGSWAYAWLLVVAAGGWGLALAGWYGQWRQPTLLIGTLVGVFGLILFVLFGAIAGGQVIRFMAPVILVLGGLALRWLPLEDILPENLIRWMNISKTDQSMINSISVEPLSSGLVEPLSSREFDVLKLINAGLSNPEIAAELVVAPSTVKTHINNLYGKLGVQNRVQAIQKGRELGLFE